MADWVDGMADKEVGKPEEINKPLEHTRKK